MKQPREPLSLNDVEQVKPFPPDVDNSILTHAAYLMMGFVNTGVLTNEEAARFGGQIGAAMHVTAFANTIANALREADQLGFEYPGVFDYEVTEGMGSWLRSNQNSTEKEFAIELVRQMERFFACDCNSISKALLSGESRLVKDAPSTRGEVNDRTRVLAINSNGSLRLSDPEYCNGDPYDAEETLLTFGVENIHPEDRAINPELEAACAALESDPEDVPVKEIEFDFQTVAELAKQFLIALRKSVGEVVYQKIIALNKGEKNPSICHSHDFIDANMVMAKAFLAVAKTEADLRSDSQTALWNRAWALAVSDMKLREVMKTFEVTGFGFDASSDETDDRVFWVRSASHDEVRKAIAGTKAIFHSTISAETDIDFHLPEQADLLRAKLLEFEPTRRDVTNAALTTLARQVSDVAQGNCYSESALKEAKGVLQSLPTSDRVASGLAVIEKALQGADYSHHGLQDVSVGLSHLSGGSSYDGNMLKLRQDEVIAQSKISSEGSPSP